MENKNGTVPSVSVVMPVYNGEEYLKQAIDSVLNQTYRNFELLIIFEYGSNDLSAKIIKSYKDSRLTVVYNEQKLGLAHSLNRGIDLARGEFIARMDADDVSFPKRLMLQTAFMNLHIDVVLCGGAISINGKRTLVYPTNCDRALYEMFFKCPFPHPAVMIRKSFLDKFDLRYRTDTAAEDYDLWTRVIRKGKAVNLKNTILMYREHGTNRSEKYKDKLREEDIEIKSRLCREFGFTYNLNGAFFETGLELKEIKKRELYLKNILKNIESFKNVQKEVEYSMISLYLNNHMRPFQQYYSCFKQYYGYAIFSYCRLWCYCFCRVIRRSFRNRLPSVNKTE